MHRRLSLFTALLLPLLLVFAACGDGPAEETPTATPTSTPDSATSGFGPDPKMTTNITNVFPANGQKVTRAETRLPVQDRPAGVCFDVNFDDLPPADARWFRLAIDGAERTDRISWFPNSAGTQATGCFATDDGLEPGRHFVAVSVQNPDNPSESPRQLVSWGFDVE